MVELSRSGEADLGRALLPGVPAQRVWAAYTKAPGNEIASGKFFSQESSAALVANAFGYFLGRPADLPAIPRCEELGWPATSLSLESVVRFPWSGGRHPCLDAVVETTEALIGIESKRYEPFRTKGAATLSDAYWRPVWGERMTGYERVRDGLRDGSIPLSYLDAAQLVKHAFGLRTAVQSRQEFRGKRPVLLYLHAEPAKWPDGCSVPDAAIEAHRAEVRCFAGLVAGDEVTFRSCTYKELLSTWTHGGNQIVRSHAEAMAVRFLV